MARKPSPTTDSEELFEIGSPEFGIHYVRAKSIEEAIEPFRQFCRENYNVRPKEKIVVDLVKHIGQVIFSVSSPRCLAAIAPVVPSAAVIEKILKGGKDEVIAFIEEQMRLMNETKRRGALSDDESTQPASPPSKAGGGTHAAAGPKKRR